MERKCALGITILFAAVYDGTKIGLADQNGKWILNPVFDDMDFVADHLIAVEYQSKWGIIRV